MAFQYKETHTHASNIGRNVNYYAIVFCCGIRNTPTPYFQIPREAQCEDRLRRLAHSQWSYWRCQLSLLGSRDFEDRDLN